MRKIIIYYFFSIFCFLPLISTCQDSIKLNDVKLNLTSLGINNYHITYERSLSKKFSLSLGLRYMPKGSLPFKKSLKNMVKSDSVNFDLLQMGNFAITPEARVYLGKGYMHGFYISIYGRYASFDLTAPVQFTSNSSGTKENILFDGKVNSFSGGIMLGMQYSLWKIVVLDIMMIGGHYGGCSGTLNAGISPPLSAQDQQSLQQSLNDINDKSKPFKVSGQVVSSTQAVIKASGPWAGVRSGINVGIRF